MRWRIPPISDAEWARGTEKRMSRLESAPTTMRIGQWVLADLDGELVLMNATGESYILTDVSLSTTTFTTTIGAVQEAIAEATSTTRFTRTVKVRLTGWVIGGTFTLTIEGTTSGPIPHNSSAANMKSILASMPNYTTTDFVVSGSNGGPWTLSFPGVNISGDNSELNYFPLFEGNVAIT